MNPIGSIKRLVTSAFGMKAVGVSHVVAPDLSSAAPRDCFIAAAGRFGPAASVLEVGTKQALEGHSTHWQRVFPAVLRQNYLMADVLPGGDVDIVANLHHLPQDWTARFDAFVANAVFEHLERPWIAAAEVARILVPGGLCYVSTHQTFPLHAYPSDFFRFSTEALSLIFADAGLEIIEVAYEHRAQILPPVTVIPASLCEQWNATWPSYIVVHLFARKPEGPSHAYVPQKV